MNPLESEYLFDEHFTLATKAIHMKPEPLHGAVNVPIYMSSTFQHTAPMELVSSYLYTRLGNPTRGALEGVIASIENNKYCIAFSSGMAAITTVVGLLNNGEQMLCCDDVYGGTQSYLRNIAQAKHGIKVTFVDMSNMENVKKHMNNDIKLIYIETPTNPTMKLVDIQQISTIAKEFNALVAVDNTFATPYLQTPSDLGADITINSGTKYLGGHSDVVFGSLSLRDKELYDQLYFISYEQGGCPSPFDCYLVHRSIKTLEVRVKQQIKNAYILAKFLERHPQIEKVLYPGLRSHPQHELAKKQMRAGGAMVSFYVKGGKAEVGTFLKKLNIFTLAVSLGGVESLIEVPASMTHANVPEGHRLELGITDNLIRMSVGLEGVQDLIQDLNNALG